MFARTMQYYLQQLMGKYPIVTVMGPRQSGKTTLVQMNYPKKAYYNLEEIDIRERIVADPREFITTNQDGAILDEIQHVPELLSYIQAEVDRNDTPGRFILTGSHQPRLHEAISQSLAGRTAILDLLPLSISELLAHGIDMPLDDWLLHGFYPAVYAKRLNPTECYRNYVRTYMEKDVRQIINVHDLAVFQRFLKLVVGRIGSLVNMESLANDVGVSHGTIRKWLSVLQSAYLIYQLPPYYENFGKRVLKSPKLYFSDVGMASYLLGIDSILQLSRDRLRGGLFENLVVTEILKERFNHGKDANIYFYRDSHGNEVDVILAVQDKLIPIEIKTTTTFNRALLKGIKNFQRVVGDRAAQGFLVYGGDQEMVVDGIHVLNYRKTATILHNFI